MKVIPSCLLSLPAWGARIERKKYSRWAQNSIVAPRMGSEDRKFDIRTKLFAKGVAPRMGSEDRKLFLVKPILF